MSKKKKGNSKDFDDLLSQLNGEGVLFNQELDDPARPVYGTTLYLASCDLETRFGSFRAYVFQDINHRGYIIALAHGDVSKAKTLYTRIHSSCVTSETLRGCDCDCVQQLEGAMRRIGEKGSGVLFYFMQEGRGVGYVAKSRDRMLVQASKDKLSTFAAYRAMGLAKDYRRYDSISSICHLLGIDAEFVVMTNNPDKVSALKAQGITVAKTETIEYDPGPYNLAYLTSKAESGHTLSKARAEYSASALPPEEVTPFTPYVLPNAKRFVHVSTYYLPMKPIDDEVLLPKEGMAEFFTVSSDGVWDLVSAQATKAGLVHSVREVNGNRHLVKINKDELRKLRLAEPTAKITRLLTRPYWFKIHVYFDIVSWAEYIVLVYDATGAANEPVVRVQSESLFNRFPLEHVESRDTFKSSVQAIVENGYGMIVLLPNDGRGAGFGAHAMDKMFCEAKMSSSTDESYDMLGVDYDSRDYSAGFALLKHHLKSDEIQMVMNNANSLVRKTEYADALNRNGLNVCKWIFLNSSLEDIDE